MNAVVIVDIGVVPGLFHQPEFESTGVDWDIRECLSLKLIRTFTRTILSV
jgi:hypothetical protein